MSKLPSYMRSEEERTEAPKLNIGQRVEAIINTISRETGQYGEQYELNVTLQPSNWRTKVWMSYYAVPAPNTHIGKLCLSIERLTGQSFSSLDAAVAAVKSHGRIFLVVTGFRQYDNKDYPKFSIVPDVLPGENMGTPVTQPQTQAMQAPVNIVTPALENANINDLSTAARMWLTVSQGLIGKTIDDATWNIMVNKGIAKDLGQYNLIEVRDDYPYLSEEARKYL